MLRTALCLVLALAPGSGSGSEAAARAEAAAATLRAAAEGLSQSETAPDRVAALTETVRAYEGGLAAYRGGLRAVVLRERAIAAAFEAEETRLSGLLAILASVETAPEITVLLHPGSALDHLRAGLLAADLAPALETRATALKAELDELAVLRALQEAAGAVLQGGLDGVQAARTGLSQAIAQRDATGSIAATDAATLQALVSGADTLQGFAETLSSLGPDAVTEARFAELKGKLPPPARGTLAEPFDPDASAPGILVTTAPRALVTTPHSATVRYAGPLLDLGMVVILEPEAGYLLILSGLSDIFIGAGEVLESGAALGLMGGSSPEVEEILIETAEGGGQDRTERLYIELRHDKNIVDPGDWFAFSEGKD